LTEIVCVLNGTSACIVTARRDGLLPTGRLCLGAVEHACSEGRYQVAWQDVMWAFSIQAMVSPRTPSV